MNMYDASIMAPSPTLLHEEDLGRTPPRRDAAPAAGGLPRVGGDAANGRLNPFHVAPVPPPASRQARPATLFAAVHPHVQRTLTRHVHKIIVTMFGLQRDGPELVATYLALPAVQQRLGAFFGHPAVEALLFAYAPPALYSPQSPRWAGGAGGNNDRPHRTTTAGPAGARLNTDVDAEPSASVIGWDGAGAEHGPVRLLYGVGGGVDSAWLSGDLLLLHKHAAVVDPYRPSACIGMTKTCGASSLLQCRDTLSTVLLPLMAAATEESWAGCAGRERRRAKHTVSEFCLVLDERAAAYSQNRRALTLPPRAVLHGMAAAGARDDNNGVAEVAGSIGEEVNILPLQESVLEPFEELAMAWIVDMERALEESAKMAIVMDQGPSAELRCWGQRVAMLGAIEKQLDSPESQLVAAVLAQNQSMLQADFKRMRTLVIEAVRSAREISRQLSTIERYVDALYTEPPMRVAQLMPTLMGSLQLMTTSSQYFCMKEHRLGMFKRINHQLVTICQTHLSALGDAWELPVKDVAACMGECHTLTDSCITHAAQALDEIENHPSSSERIDRTALFQPLKAFTDRLQLIEGILSTIEIYSNFKRTMLRIPTLSFFDDALSEFCAAVVDLKHNVPDVLDLSTPQLEHHADEFLIAKNQMETRIGEILGAQLEVEGTTEKGMELLAVLRTVLPESMGRLLTEKLVAVVDNYAALLHRVQKRYEKQKNDPPLPRNFPQAAGHVAWVRHLQETVDRPMRSMCAEEATHRMLTRDVENSGKVLRAHKQLMKTFRSYERLWYDGWCKTLVAAREGLKATVIVRHPEDGELYVNFDPGLQLLVREAYCFERMGKRVPEVARQVLLRGTQLLQLRNTVGLLLDMRERVLMMLPAQSEVKALLAPRCKALESSLAIGMTTVTWSSLYAQSWTTTMIGQIVELKAGIEQTKRQLDVVTQQLRAVSSAVLVSLPEDGGLITVGDDDEAGSANQATVQREPSLGDGGKASILSASTLHQWQKSDSDTSAAAVVRSTVVTVDGFVAMQDELCARVSRWLQEQNELIESSVDELVVIAVGIGQRLPASQVRKFKHFFRNCMYRAVLGATTASLQKLKSRFSATSYGFLFVDRPFFDVDVELTVPTVRLSPDLDTIQAAVNRVSRSVLNCSAQLRDWQGCTQPNGAGPLVGLGSDWPQGHAGSVSPFYARLAKDRVVMLSVISLTGSVNNLRDATHQYLQGLRSFNYLWQEDARAAFQAFLQTTTRGGEVTGKARPALSEVGARLKQYSMVEAQIRSLRPVHNIGPLSIETAALKHSLGAFVVVWKNTFATDTLQEAMDLTQNANALITQLESRLAIQPSNIDDVRLIMETLKLVRDTEADVAADLSKAEAIYGVMALNKIALPDGSLTPDQLELLRQRSSNLHVHSAQVAERMREIQDDYRKDVVRRSRRFKIKLIDFRTVWEREGPNADGLTPQEAVRQLAALEDGFHRLSNEEAIIVADEQLFGVHPVSVFGELTEMRQELRFFKELFPLRCRVLEMIAMIKDISWVESKHRLADLDRSMTKEYTLLQKVSPQVMVMPEAQDLAKEMNDASACLSVARQMASKYIRWRHWIKAQELLSLEIIPAQDDVFQAPQEISPTEHVDTGRPRVFRLGNLLGPHVTEQEAAGSVAALCDAAEREYRLEQTLQQVVTDWAEKSFIFRPYKNRGLLLFDQEHMTWLLEQAEDTTTHMGAVLNSPYLASMREEVVNWIHKMTAVEAIILKYMHMQTLWSQLEVIFCTEDGQAAKSVEERELTANFMAVDRQYEIVMKRACAETGGVINNCLGIDGLGDSLDNVISRLQICKQAMGSFLALKRCQFPRFFFLTDNAVLDVLAACNHNARLLSMHIGSVFAGVATAHFNDAVSKPRVESVSSSAVAVEEGETLSLLAPVECAGSAETWLADLEKALHDSIANAIMSTRATNPTAVTLAARCPVTQVALVVLRMRWTERCERAIRNGSHDGIIQVRDHTRTIMDQLVEHLDAKNSTLVSRTVRRRAHSLVQQLLQSYEICVRLAEIFREQSRHAHLSVDQFEWQVQSRAYAVHTDPYVQSIDSTGEASSWSCHICIGYARFAYGNEFLAGEARGSQQRMVSTPLTDRCQLSLAQAAYAYFGGAVVGPSATGKTATVRELANSLGVATVLFCCTKQADATHVGSLLRGIAQTGCWLCMDSFESLSPNLLSVVSTTVQSIFAALREHLSASQVVVGGQTQLSQCTCTFPGDERAAVLNRRAAICITVTPSLSVRPNASLSADLSAFFKPVIFAVPELAAIARIRLAVGRFRNSGSLSRKISAFYRQCEHQLSTQPHYDFSIRAVIRVVESMCEEKQRREACGRMSVADEHQICCLALRQVTGCTLVRGDDCILFAALLGEVFPTDGIQDGSTSDTDKTLRRDHPKAILRGYFESGKSTLNRCPELVEKAVQLYVAAALDSSVGRCKCMGLAIVGPAASGKSEVRKELLAALNMKSMSAGEHKEVATINPKTMHIRQLYGEMDCRNEWTDGIFTQALRRANAVATAAVVDVRTGKKETLAGKAASSVTQESDVNGDKLDGSTWITMDGALDSSWIDGLDTIFDESQQRFVLITGEQIEVHSHVRLCFETDTLQKLSPSTTSRLAIVYIPTLGADPDNGSNTLWNSVFENWAERIREMLQTNSRLEHNQMVHTCRTVIATMMHALNNFPDAGSGSSNCVLYTKTFCRLVQAWLPHLQSLQDRCDTSDKVEQAFDRIAIFAATWSFGSAAVLMAQAQREAIDAALRSLQRHNTAATPENIAGASGKMNAPVIRREQQPLVGLSDGAMPALNIEEHFSTRKLEDALIYDYSLKPASFEWVPWRDLVDPKPAANSLGATSTPARFARGGWAECYVTTTDTLPCITLMELLAALPPDANGAIHMLVTGRSEGKTAVVQEFLTRQPSSRVQTQYVSLSQTTNLHTVSSVVHDNVELRHHTTFGPSRRRQALMICIDDLHLPSDDTWGAWPVHEEVRQLAERHEFHAAADNATLHKPGKQLKVVGCSIIAVARTDINSKPTSTDAVLGLPARLRHHFVEIPLALYRTASMRTIFTSVLNTTLASGGVGQTVIREGWSTVESACCAENQMVTPLLAEIAVKLVTHASKTFVPTPSKAHYVFDFRDVMRILRGMCHGVRHAGVACQLSPQTLLHLCVHECCRVLQDKLVDPTDFHTMTELMGDHITRISSRSDALRHESFADMHSSWYYRHFAPSVQPQAQWSGSVYEYAARGSITEFEEPVTAAMSSHRGVEHGQLRLVWSTDHMKQLLRMARNMATSAVQIIVGHPGSDRSRLVHMACRVCHSSVQVLRTDDMHGFLVQLGAAIVSAAMKNKEVVLVMRLPAGTAWTGDAHVAITEAHAKMIDILSNLVSNGEEAYHVLPHTCREAIASAVEGFKESLTASESTSLQDSVATGEACLTMERLRGKFIEKALRNMHFCFLVPPEHHAAFVSRHPVLASTSSALVLLGKPHTSELADIAKRIINNAKGNALQKLNETDVHRVCLCMADVYELLHDSAARKDSTIEQRDIRSERRSAMVRMSICRFKACVMTLLQVFQEQHTALYGHRAKLETSLRNALLIGDGITAMDAKKDCLIKLIASLDTSKDELVYKIAAQKKQIGKGKTSLLMMEKYTDAERQVLAKKQDSFNKLLDDFDPKLEEAVGAVKYIERSDLGAMKRFVTPPASLCCTIDALLLLFHRQVHKTEYENVGGETEDAGQVLRLKLSYDSQEGRRVRQNLSLQQELIEFRKRHGNINDETLELLEPYYNILPGRQFDSPAALNVFGTLGGLSSWVASQISYERSSQLLEPQRAELEQYRSKYRTTLKRCKERQQEVVAAGVALDVLKRKHDECVQERQQARNLLRETEEAQQIADEMVPTMRRHRMRWEEMMSFFSREVEHLLGNCCLSACYISYLGPYNEQDRLHLCKSMEEVFNANGIQTGTNLNISTFLVDKLEAEYWTFAGGLSDDSFSRHNAAIALQNVKFQACLCIDPQGQARRWLAASDPNTVVHTFTDRESFLAQLEQSLGLGETLLICNADAALEHIPTVLLKHVQNDNQMVEHSSDLDLEHEEYIAPLSEGETAGERSNGSPPSLVAHQNVRQHQQPTSRHSIFEQIRIRSLARRLRGQQAKRPASGRPDTEANSDEEDAEAVDAATAEAERHIRWTPADGFKLFLVCDDPDAINAQVDSLAKIRVVRFDMPTIAVEQHLMHTAAKVGNPNLVAEQARWSVKVCAAAKAAYDSEMEVRTALQALDCADSGSFKSLARAAARLDAAQNLHSKCTTGCLSLNNPEDGPDMLDEYRPLATRAALIYKQVTLLEQLQPYSVLTFSLFVQSFSRCISAPSGHDLDHNPRKTTAAGSAALKRRLTAHLLTICCAGLNPENGSTFALALALSARQTRGAVSLQLVNAFVTGDAPPGLAQSDRGPPNNSGWLPEELWCSVVALSSAAASFKELYRTQGISSDAAVATGIAVNTLGDLPRLLNTARTSIRWRKWCEAGGSELQPFPLDGAMLATMSSFERMCIVRCLRPDLTWIAAHLFIQDELDLGAANPGAQGESSCNMDLVTLGVAGSDVYRGASGRLAGRVEQVADSLASPVTPILYILPQADTWTGMGGSGSLGAGGLHDSIRKPLEAMAQDRGTHLVVTWVQESSDNKPQRPPDHQQEQDLDSNSRSQIQQNTSGPRATSEGALLAMVKREMKVGGWVLLLAAHRSVGAMQRLETTLVAAQASRLHQVDGRYVEEIHDGSVAALHSNFKLFIVAEAPQGDLRLPRSLVAKSITIAALPPDGMAATITSACNSKSLGLNMQTVAKNEVDTGNVVWQRLTTVAVYLHALLLGRRRTFDSGCGYGALGFSSRVLFDEDDLCDALVAMRSVWTNLVTTGSQAALTHSDGTVWRRLRHAFVTSSYGSRLQDPLDDRLLGELVSLTMGPLLLDDKAAIPSAPLHVQAVAAVADAPHGTGAGVYVKPCTPVPPAHSPDSVGAWLTEWPDAFATGPECYWLHPHAALEMRLQSVAMANAHIEGYLAAESATLSLTGVLSNAMATYERPSTGEESTPGSQSVLADIERNYDISAVGAASAGKALSSISPITTRSSDTTGTPQPPRTRRSSERSGSGRTQFWAGGKNDHTSAQQLQKAARNITAVNSIGKVVDDIKRVAAVASPVGAKAASSRTGLVTDAKHLVQVDARRSYGMTYSDHHAGQFVRKTKVGAVVRINGHLVTPEEERTLRTVTELLERSPPSLMAVDVDQQLRRLDGLQSGDALRPLSRYVQQEAESLQVLLSTVRRDLHRARLRLAGHAAGIGGSHASTKHAEELETDSIVRALMHAEVPNTWLGTPARCGPLGGSSFRATAFSSIGSLGRWYSCFLQCHEQIWRWIFEGPPLCIWMAGLTNPSGLIAAVRQEACRTLGQPSMPVLLDQVGIEWSVTSYLTPRELQEAPVNAERESQGRYSFSTGVYVYGLHLEGASWDKNRAELTELDDKYRIPRSSSRAAAFTGKDLRITSLPVMRIHGVYDSHAHAVIVKHEQDLDDARIAGVGDTAAAALLCGVALEDPDQLCESLRVGGAAVAVNSTTHGVDPVGDGSPSRGSRFGCAIYATGARSDIVGVVRLPVGAKTAGHWALRGVAILCCTQ